MNQKQQLAKLGQLSNLLLDSRLAVLQAAARAKQESQAQLDGLLLPAPEADEISEIAGALAALNYQRWADARRAELNMLLARQTAAWLEARDSAREAFGKKQALGGVAAKLTAQRRSGD